MRNVGIYRTYWAIQNIREVSRQLQSRIRCHFTTRPLHVTSLKDSFLFYDCVPHKATKRHSLSNLEYSRFEYSRFGRDTRQRVNSDVSKNIYTYIHIDIYIYRYIYASIPARTKHRHTYTHTCNCGLHCEINRESILDNCFLNTYIHIRVFVNICT